MAGIPSVQVFLGEETTVDGSGPTIRTNLFTDPACTALTTWTYWAGSGGTAALAVGSGGSALSTFGGSFLRITWSTPPTSGGGFIANTTGVAASLTYTVSAYIRPPVTLTILPQWQWFSAGTPTSSGSGTSVVCPAGVWTRVSATATVPAGSNQVQWRWYISGAGITTAGQVMDFSAALWEQSATLGDYFDGSMTCCAWTGPANGSSSTSSWTEVTTYLALEQGVTTNRGQSYGGGSQPGTASLTLVNTDGRFTIGNTSSPLSPYFRLQAPMKLLRDGRPWFVGRITAAPLSWPAGGDSDCLVTVTLADELARYDLMRLDSFPVEEIKSLGPSGYWPMAEPSGSTHADNAMPTAWPLTYYQPGDGTIAFAGSTGPAGDGRSVPTFTAGTTPAYLLSGAGSLDTTASSSLCLSFAFSSTAGGLIARIQTTTSTTPTILDAQATTYSGSPGIMLSIYYNDPLHYGGQYFFAATVLDGATHVVAVQIGESGSTAPTCWVDGVSKAVNQLGPSMGQTSIAASGATISVGWAPLVNSSFTVSGFSGALGHIALFPRALTSAEIAQVRAGLVGTTLTTLAAFTKVLGWRGQTGLIDSGVTDGIASTTLGNASLASILAALNSSEAGTLWVDGLGQLTWKNRRTLPAPSITLTQDDIDPGIVYNSDLTRVKTLVTASRYNGGNVTVKAADYDTVGEITGSVASLTTDPNDPAQHASWVANTGPRIPYIGSLTVDLATATSSAYAAATSVTILGKVTLTGMPSQTPPNSTVLEVIGEQETIAQSTSGGSWNLTWTVLPAGIGSARDVLTLDDATYGVLDSTHRLAY